MKCHVKRQYPSKPVSKVHQTSGAHQRFAEDSAESDESIFITERVRVISSNETRSSFMVPFNFHTEYNPTVTTQLDTGATCSAMSYKDLLNILQLGEVELDPHGGKIRLYDGSVVNPLCSYIFSVCRNSGPKCKIKFDILENAPWPIIDGRTCTDQGWISLGTEASVQSLNSKHYEPLTMEKRLKEYEAVFTGLGYLPG